jgi:hypothetical protein
MPLLVRETQADDLVGERIPPIYGGGTHEAMTENQAIYARLGYVEIERQSEDGYRRIYMEKPLTD